MVSGLHKLDALTRILETETFDGMLIFTRTKQSTVELAEKLEARGFSAAPLNGDIPQSQRERTVARLRAGEIDIVVATDVAARGLDVERIGHVVNYDAPYDGESYVHRIGRTGRAGRSGEAILFIAPREGSLLRAIERATRQKIEPMDLPDRRCGERFARRQVQGADLRDRRQGKGCGISPHPARARNGDGDAPHRYRRGAREPRAGRIAAAAQRRGSFPLERTIGRGNEAAPRNEARRGSQACAGNRMRSATPPTGAGTASSADASGLSLKGDVDSTKRRKR